MIITVVHLAQRTTAAEIAQTFQTTAPKYQEVPGLLLKNYWLSEDGHARAAFMSGRRGPMQTGSIRLNGSVWRANTASNQ
jgi:hypothetical protein